MGVATSCNSGCNRLAVWSLQLDHQELEKMKVKIDLTAPTNFIDDLHANFEKARLLAETIRPIVGSIDISYSAGMKMTSYLCAECFRKVKLNDLPEEWGYEVYGSRNGYYHK